MCFFFNFSLATDGSNDNTAKLYPIVVKVYDEAEGAIATRVLACPQLELASTAENITQLMLTELDHHSVKIDNMVSFCSDNTAVMVGRNSGVATKLKDVHPSLLIVGCACHLMDLAAKKAFSELPVQIDQLLLDVYYYLEPSDKRIRDFKEYQLIRNDGFRKILKYCPTRWLSLGKCIRRLIDVWIPLKDFISAQMDTEIKKAEKKAAAASKKAGHQDAGDAIIETWFATPDSTAASSSSTASTAATGQSNARLKRIHDALHSRRTLAYCLFLKWILELFERPNEALQHEKPLIHKTHSILLSMYKSLLVILIKPKIISDAGDALIDIDFTNSANHLPDKDMYYGESAMAIADKMSASNRAAFKQKCKSFITKALTYMQQKFPMKDDLLVNARVADISKRLDVSFSDVWYFASRLPTISRDVLHRQFLLYQSYSFSSHLLSIDRADHQWHEVKQIRNCVGDLMFPELCRVMLSVLTIPHSNASSERVFSMVRKNRTSARSSLSTKTLESILINKFSSTRSAGMSEDLLRKCKSATYNALKQ